MKKFIGIFLLAFFTTIWANQKQYAIIVDAGSTGSRLNIYSYQQNPHAALPSIKLIAHQKLKPGLENFVSNPKLIGDYFEPLLKFAKDKLKNLTKANQVSFSILGTGGMRLVDKIGQNKIYANLKKYLQNNCKFKIIVAKTIHGKQEGIFNWLTINYLTKRLQSNKTIGAIDMGGTSTEIAFETHNTPLTFDKTIIHIGGKTHQLYSHSFLGLGQDISRAQYLNHTYCFPVNYSTPSGEISHLGYDYNKCYKSLTVLINQIHKADKKTPTVKHNMPFILTSGFDYTINSKFYHLGHSFTIYNYKKKAIAMCKKPWNELVKKYGDDPYIYSYCYNAAFHIALLTEGYRISQDQKLYSYNKISNISLDWTLGALLYYLNNDGFEI